MIQPADFPSWLARAWEQLCHLQEQPPSAALLVSPQSGDAHVLAELWARLLLCEAAMPQQQEACGSCRSCREINAGTHPDYLRVTKLEDKRELGIDLIRDAITWSAKTARQQRRVLYIQDAETLNNNAANAFLKTLEEPADGLIILLSCRRLNSLPITLRSRCHRVPIASPSGAEYRAFLLRAGYSSQKIDAAIELMPGDIFAVSTIDESTLEQLGRWKQAWKRGVEQGDTMAAAEILDNEDWPQSLAWIQRKMLVWAQSRAAANDMAEAWKLTVRIRAMSSIALNRRLQVEELLMLLRTAWRRHLAST